MFAVSPVAITPTALSVVPSTITAPASDLVSTRLTSVALSAPLSDTQLNNDVPPATVPAPAAIEAEEQDVSATAVATGGSTLTTSGPSSAFLAQLISQNSDTQEDDNQIALDSSFSRFAPALEYDTLLGYGVVKYRPSNAGLPSPYASSTTTSEEVLDNPQAITAANEYQAYSLTQSRNQSQLNISEEYQLQVAG